MQTQELKELKELLEIASVLKGLMGNKEIELTAQRGKSISKPKLKKKDSEKGFSDSAVKLLRAFNTVNAHRNKVQKRKLISEYKAEPNREITIPVSVWDKGGFKGVENKTFKTDKGGVVIEIQHTKAGYTDQKFVNSVSNKEGKQIAVYEG